MKVFILFVSTWASASYPFATPSRMIDGKIQFAVSEVNGVTCWTTQDKQFQVDQYNLSSGSFPLVISDFALINYEINLATCVLSDSSGNSFENHADFIQCQTRQGLAKKIRTMRSFIESSSDLPIGTLLDYLQRIRWLKSYYISLP